MTIRITGGTAKGRSIPSPRALEIRPTSSKVREALFNILGSRISGCGFLDLFAGSGIMGLEALSRGANRVLFIDQSHNAIKSIKMTLDKLGFEADTICGDIQDKIPGLSGRDFEIIFADPPYAGSLASTALRLVERHSILSRRSDSLFILEHDSKSNPANKLSAELEQVDKRIYGQTAISFFAYTK